MVLSHWVANFLRVMMCNFHAQSAMEFSLARHDFLFPQQWNQYEPAYFASPCSIIDSSSPCASGISPVKGRSKPKRYRTHFAPNTARQRRDRLLPRFWASSFSGSNKRRGEDVGGSFVCATNLALKNRLFRKYITCCRFWRYCCWVLRGTFPSGGRWCGIKPR